MSRLDDVNKIGTLFNSWGKILISIGCAVVSCAWAYYEIYQNKSDISLERKDRIEHITILEERSEKKYDRAIEMAKSLEDLGMRLEERVRQLEIENAHMKGKYESTKK